MPKINGRSNLKNINWNMQCIVICLSMPMPMAMTSYGYVQLSQAAEVKYVRLKTKTSLS